MRHYSKDAAEYEPQAKHEDHCGECSYFEAPASCEIVHGKISPAGWCRFFRERRGQADDKDGD